MVVGIGGFAIFGGLWRTCFMGFGRLSQAWLDCLRGDVGGGVCGECGAGLEGGAVGADGGVAGGVRGKLASGAEAPLIGLSC